MTMEKFVISFEMPVERSTLKIQLTADVYVQSSPACYIVDHIKSRPGGNDVLPSLAIKLVKGKWVHMDTKLESALSAVIGKAIEASPVYCLRKLPNK